jgi:hypothetical protein
MPSPRLSKSYNDALREWQLSLFENPPQTTTPAPLPLYPLDRTAVEWVTFADETGCGLWLDDPAGVGAREDEG